MQRDKQEKFLEMEVDDMNISTRLYGCLKKAKIENGMQLLSYHHEEFLFIGNFGKRTLSELNEFVQGYGYTLGCFYSDGKENPFGPISKDAYYVAPRSPVRDLSTSDELRRSIRHFLVEINGTSVKFPVGKVKIIFKR